MEVGMCCDEDGKLNLKDIWSERERSKVFYIGLFGRAKKKSVP